MSVNKTQLTKKHWLNIIIFVVSALFLLMVLLNQRLSQTDIKSNRIIPQTKHSSSDVRLIKIDFGHVMLWSENDGNEAERNKMEESKIKHWRSSSDQLNQQTFDMIVANWIQLLAMKSEAQEVRYSSGITVLLYFSNLTQPVICKLTQQDSDLVVTFVASRQQLLLKNQNINAYYPELN